ncbi:hypothetical protein Leryth_017486 [Lithospermum erythrorhizon]|nr:hypothetical protein Leryth_017486 [Lithospermum erythrorhizon]
MSVLFCGSGCLVSSLGNYEIKKSIEQLAIYSRATIPPLVITRCNNINNGLVTSREFEESVSRIKEMFRTKVDISESAYDTAWVAMVPSRRENGGDSNGPRFPQCLVWVMENQHKDGSWGLDPHHPKLVKDSLSCTLASILALQKWSVGEQLVQRGLDYIGKNSWAINRSDQLSPAGFDIIFPAMIHHSMEMNLNLPLEPAMVNGMLQSRKKEIERFMEGNFGTIVNNMGHIVEGLVEENHWDLLQIIRILDEKSWWSIISPASNAAILMHFHDKKCFEYLSSALNEFGDYVPTIYPISMRMRLHMVDTLQKFGVARYFKDEIDHVLEETYRLWQQKQDDIFSDIMCTAMAFRLLRTNGHQVSSDGLADGIMNIPCPTTTLELYKASQLSIYENEDALHSIDAWTTTFLNQQLQTPSNIISKEYFKEVEDFLRFNYHGLPGRVESRLALENYEANTIQMLKTSYRSKNFNSNEDILKISKEDYNHCQALHQNEVQELERWYKSHKLDCLTFPRHYLYTIYFLISSTLFEPEFSEARIVWTQCTILITIIDNIIDSWDTTSKEELKDITKLAELWDDDSMISHNISEQVEIFFNALHRTVDDQATRASIHQGRSVRSHLISLWQEIIKNMMQEVEWGTQNAAPSMDEYLLVGCITIGIKMVVSTSMYFVGEKVALDMLEGEEIHNLWWHASQTGRLLNDLQTYKKKLLEGQLNIINLQISQGSISQEEAETSIRVMIESARRKLLHSVLQSKESLIPKLCKKLFWIACISCYYVYSSSDEFNSPQEIKKHINQVIHDAL